MASPEIIVRQALTSDAVALRAILYATYESTWLPHLTPAAAQVYFKEDRPAAYVATRSLRFWVAEQNEEILAFVDWEGDFVNALHVLPSHARMGLGNCLMAVAETQILHAGFVTARLETDSFNTRSQAFYAARSYREVDRYPDEEWNSGLTTILFVKPLN